MCGLHPGGRNYNTIAYSLYHIKINTLVRDQDIIVASPRNSLPHLKSRRVYYFSMKCFEIHAVLFLHNAIKVLGSAFTKSRNMFSIKVNY